MKRAMLLLLATAALAGCQAPPPSLNPFAPAQTRVPPPSTGSYGKPTNYYPQSNVSGAFPAGSSLAAMTARGAAAPWRATASSQTPTAAAKSSASSESAGQTSAVRHASHQAPAEAEYKEPPIRIVERGAEPAAKAGATAKIEAKSEATKPKAEPKEPATTQVAAADSGADAEPEKFSPPGDAIEISQLPKHSATISKATAKSPSVEKENESEAASIEVVSSSTKTDAPSDESSSSSSESGLRNDVPLKWKPRYVPSES